MDELNYAEVFKKYPNLLEISMTFKNDIVFTHSEFPTKEELDKIYCREIPIPEKLDKLYSEYKKRCAILGVEYCPESFIHDMDKFDTENPYHTVSVERFIK